MSPKATGDSGAADDLPEVQVPDDASALEADRLRYLDEQARGVGRAEGPDWSMREPQPTLPGFLTTRRWGKYGLSGPLVVAVLVVVGVLGSFMTVLRPNVASAPGPLPLANAQASVLPGGSGGLLPAADVQLEGIDVDLQRLRPVVLVVVPEACPTCADVTSTAVQQARQFGLRTVLVGTAPQARQLIDLSRDATRRLAAVALDTSGALTSLYPGPGPTLVMVHADGIVADVVVDPSSTVRLEPVLSQLSRAGATATA
jgi:hypothetical protein